MANIQLIAEAAPAIARSARHWIFHLGALGFIPLGLLDSSVVPIPGSMDVLVIVLCARNADIWIYYAVMATLGSVIGAYVTYRLARKGGKEALMRRFPKRKVERAYKIFSRWGFGAIAIPAVLPPPVPMVPFVLAAGAMQYSVNKFLLAMIAGRSVRYCVLGYLSARYGRYMLRFITELPHPVLIIAIVLAVAATTAVVFLLSSKRKKSAAA
ncbi:MAG: VTT domain-containing protein [Candidatus Acidiferrales bacterium]